MNFNELQILRLAYNLNQLASNQVGSSAESRCRKSIGIENLIVLRAYRATSNNNQFVNLKALLLITSTPTRPLPIRNRSLTIKCIKIYFSFSCLQMRAWPKRAWPKKQPWNCGSQQFRIDHGSNVRFYICFQPKNKTIREEAGASLRSLGPIEPRLE